MYKAYCNNTHQEDTDFFVWSYLCLCQSRLCSQTNNSRMESVTIILLRCECVNVGEPFFSQIHTLEGREPACLRAFLVLKDWNILTHIAVDCVMCAVLQTCAFQTCTDIHWDIMLYVLKCNNLLYMAHSRY